MEVITNSVFVNAATILVVAISLLFLRNSKVHSKRLFIIGLLLILLSGFVAIPLTHYFIEKMNIFLLSNIVGLIHAAGILCCVVAFRGKENGV